jgi:DNA-binding MarR family transcriptional regulator
MQISQATQFVKINADAWRWYALQMSADQEVPVVRAWARLMKSQRIALASIQRALKASNLPSLEWYDALLELERAGEQGLRPYELERNMLLAQYNLSRLVERMAKSGYVERQPCEDDGRGQVLVITTAGKALRRRMWHVYGPAIAQAFGGRLSAGEAVVLDEILGAYIERSQDE